MLPRRYMVIPVLALAFALPGAGCGEATRDKPAVRSVKQIESGAEAVKQIESELRVGRARIKHSAKELAKAEREVDALEGR